MAVQHVVRSALILITPDAGHTSRRIILCPPIAPVPAPLPTTRVFGTASTIVGIVFPAVVGEYDTAICIELRLTIWAPLGDIDLVVGVRDLESGSQKREEGEEFHYREWGFRERCSVYGRLHIFDQENAP